MNRTLLWSIFQAGIDRDAKTACSIIESLLSPAATFDVALMREKGLLIHFIKLLREEFNLLLIDAKAIADSGKLDPKYRTTKVVEFLLKNGLV